MKPALTGIEWAAALQNEFMRQMMLQESCDPVKGNDHIRAALSLYGQPFGFTHEDLKVLEHCEASVGWKYEEEVRSLAERIKALLPPQ